MRHKRNTFGSTPNWQKKQSAHQLVNTIFALKHGDGSIILYWASCSSFQWQRLGFWPELRVGWIQQGPWRSHPRVHITLEQGKGSPFSMTRTPQSIQSRRHQSGFNQCLSGPSMQTPEDGRSQTLPVQLYIYYRTSATTKSRIHLVALTSIIGFKSTHHTLHTHLTLPFCVSDYSAVYYYCSDWLHSKLPFTLPMLVLRAITLSTLILLLWIQLMWTLHCYLQWNFLFWHLYLEAF